MQDASYTVDIDQDTAVRLTRLADEEQITVEGLLQHILRSYLAWKLVSAKAEFSPIPKYVLKAFLNNMPDEQLKELAVSSADDFRDIVIQTFGGIDLEIILTLTDERARRSGFIFRRFDDNDDNNNDGDGADSNRPTSKSSSSDILQNSTPFKTIDMEHIMGIKWSTFFKMHMEALLRNLGYSLKTDYTDSWWSMQIW